MMDDKQKHYKFIPCKTDELGDNEAPCDRKCGPPGSPDRRACCGCPEWGEWDKRGKEFAKAHGLTDEMLKNEAVKRYIAAYNECVFASRALKAAKERDIKAGLAYQDARDAFTISAPVTVTHKIKEDNHD